MALAVATRQGPALSSSPAAVEPSRPDCGALRAEAVVAERQGRFRDSAGDWGRFAVGCSAESDAQPAFRRAMHYWVALHDYATLEGNFREVLVRRLFDADLRLEVRILIGEHQAEQDRWSEVLETLRSEEPGAGKESGAERWALIALARLETGERATAARALTHAEQALADVRSERAARGVPPQEWFDLPLSTRVALDALGQSHVELYCQKPAPVAVPDIRRARDPVTLLDRWAKAEMVRYRALERACVDQLASLGEHRSPEFTQVALNKVIFVFDEQLQRLRGATRAVEFNPPRYVDLFQHRAAPFTEFFAFYFGAIRELAKVCREQSTRTGSSSSCYVERPVSRRSSLPGSVPPDIELPVEIAPPLRSSGLRALRFLPEPRNGAAAMP